MADTDKYGIGTKDLEKGLRTTPASAFRTIAINAVLILLVFNSEGLVRWTQALPSNPASSWIAERASDWHRLMQVPPADVYAGIKKLLKVE